MEFGLAPGRMAILTPIFSKVEWPRGNYGKVIQENHTQPNDKPYSELEDGRILYTLCYGSRND